MPRTMAGGWRLSYIAPPSDFDVTIRCAMGRIVPWRTDGPQGLQTSSRHLPVEQAPSATEVL